MLTAEMLVQKLKTKYGSVLDFKLICDDEGIIYLKEKIRDGVNGFYCRIGGKKFIVVNQELTREERRDWAWHELFHHFKSCEIPDDVFIARDEKNASLFAALVRIESVQKDDTMFNLVERYNVSEWLAMVRLEYELKTKVVRR